MDLLARLEALPVLPFHYRLLALIGVGWLFDAMDTGLIAFVLPLLAKQWQLSPQELGYIGSIGLVGMALGAVLAGTFAEKLGRKKVFAITLVLYGLSTGLCGLSWNYESLLFFRFLVGFGLGGQLPVAVTLMTEYSPSHKRGLFIVLLESFWALGWLAAAVIAYVLIPRYGWPIAFFIGAIPAVYVFIVWRHVPESVRYLVQKGRLNEAHEIVSSMEKQAGFKVHEQIVAPAFERAATATTQSVKELFRPALVGRTLLLWLIWFGIVYSYYGIFTWLPSLMVGQGYALFKTFEYVLIMTVAQLPGYFTAAYLVDRWGRKPTLALFLVACAISSYFFGQGGSANQVLLWGSLMSFFNLGAWGVIYTYTPELYPTQVRALGSGWAAAVGRFGGIAAPSVVGWMLAWQGGFQSIFFMFMAVLLVVGIAVWLFGVETKQATLEENL